MQLSQLVFGHKYRKEISFTSSLASVHFLPDEVIHVEHSCSENISRKARPAA